MTEARKAELYLGALAWCREQAANIMAVSRTGCLESGGETREMFASINSMASDLAINLELELERIAAALRAHAEKDAI